MKQPIYGWTAGKCDYCKEANMDVLRLGDGQRICDSCWDKTYGQEREENKRNP